MQHRVQLVARSSVATHGRQALSGGEVAQLLMMDNSLVLVR